MIKAVDLVYHCHTEFEQLEDVLKKHRPVIGFVPFIKDRVQYSIVRHFNAEGIQKREGIDYAWFKRLNKPWQIPARTHRYIKSFKPNLVVVHGFIFPLQVLALKLSVGTKCRIVLQHHGDQPANSVRKLFQQLADSFAVDGYMFTNRDIAKPWIRHGIISSPQKIIEIKAASVYVEKKDRVLCKKMLGLNGDLNFLWVGRLNANKDPLTILKAFAAFAVKNPGASLHMIYQTAELLNEVEDFIGEQPYLSSKIHLHGPMQKEAIVDWYNAADFFLLGSHAEAAGYALLEAMSVGCIPIVTNIPAFRSLLGNGKAGWLFEVGNAYSLLTAIENACTKNNAITSTAVEKYFHEQLGDTQVADNMYSFLCNQLLIE